MRCEACQDRRQIFVLCPHCSGNGEVNERACGACGACGEVLKPCHDCPPEGQFAWLNNELWGVEVGSFKAVSNKSYHASQMLSSSYLKRVLTHSVEHANHDKLSSTSSATQQLGSAAHIAAFEPELFDTCVMTTPNVDKRTNEGRAAWLAFEEERATKPHLITLTADDVERALRIGEAVRASPIMRELMCEPHHVESSHTFEIDDDFGKFRPDFMTESGVIVDLKTAFDASYDGFARAVAQYSYHLQAAWYCDGFEALLGRAPLQHLFVVAEKAAPYATAVYALDDAALVRGREAYKAALAKLKLARVNSNFKSYPQAIQVLTLPSWAK